MPYYSQCAVFASLSAFFHINLHHNNNKDVSMKLCGIVYSAHVRSSMLHGSEMWLMKRENVTALQRAEMRMFRWMCEIRLRDKSSCVALRHRLGTECGAAKQIKMV